jgi:hypothetical protein
VETTQPNIASRKPDTEHGHASALDEGESSFNSITHELLSDTNPLIPTRNDTALDIDEFDDDFEGFSDNIDEILAGCDETPSSKLPRIIQQPQRLEHPLAHNSRGGPLVVQEASNNESNERYMTSSDEFGDDDFDLDCFDQAIPQTGENGPDNNSRGRKAIKRYLIVDIAESTYPTQRGRIQPEKVCYTCPESLPAYTNSVTRFYRYKTRSRNVKRLSCFGIPGSIARAKRTSIST